jgi:hypothetical protein
MLFVDAVARQLGDPVRVGRAYFALRAYGESLRNTAIRKSEGQSHRPRYPLGSNCNENHGDKDPNIIWYVIQSITTQLKQGFLHSVTHCLLTGFAALAEAHLIRPPFAVPFLEAKKPSSISVLKNYRWPRKECQKGHGREGLIHVEGRGIRTLLNADIAQDKGTILQLRHFIETHLKSQGATK